MRARYNLTQKALQQMCVGERKGREEVPIFPNEFHFGSLKFFNVFNIWIKVWGIKFCSN
jgi:hypothetical protein